MRYVCTSNVGTALLRATGTRLGRPMRYNCILIATLLTCASAGLSERAYGEEWVVSSSGGGQFEDIQSAVDIASDGDQITVLPGVYVGTGDYVAEIADKTLYIIAAGGPGQTRIDGQFQRGGLKWVGDGAADGLIQGFWFNNCKVAGSGGGLHLDRTSPAIEQCWFIGGDAVLGAGAYMDESDSTFQDCQFQSNTVSEKGGAIYAKYSGYELENCSFTSNDALQRGGAIRNWESSPTIKTCSFTNSDGGERGGAIHSQSNSSCTYSECVFVLNTCDSLGGAVVDNGGSNSVYYNCTFSQNTSTGENGGQGRGGAAYSDSSYVEFYSCTFSNNTSNSVGGAIYNWSTAGAVIGGTIFDNQGSSGGAIYTASSSYTQVVSGVEICGNSSPQIQGNWSSQNGTCVADDCDELDADDDGDGIPNGCDSCPSWPGECSDDGETITVQPGEDAQAAIDACVTGGSVVLAAGEHVLAGSLNFNGKSITVLGVLGSKGQFLTTVTTTGDNPIIVIASGETDAYLKYLHLTSANHQSGDGGAIYLSGSTPTLSNCKISDCGAVSGGAICLKNTIGAIHIDQFDIDGCSATTYGGGIFANGSDVRFTRTSIRECSANYGGGIYALSTNLTYFDNGQIESNSAVNKGGGLRAYTNSSVHIDDSSVSGNVSLGDGGGIHAEGATNLLCENSVIEGNTASAYGGGIAALSSTEIDSCYIESNVSQVGGAIYIDDAQTTINQCDIFSNTADVGGGIRSESSANFPWGPSITESRFCENEPENLSGVITSVLNGSNCFAVFCSDSDNNGVLDECEPTPALPGLQGPLVDGSWIAWNNSNILDTNDGFSFTCATSMGRAAFVDPARGIALYSHDFEDKSWVLDQWIEAPDLDGDGLPDTEGGFGKSISMDGDLLVVGAPTSRYPDTGTGGDFSGRVFVYAFHADGNWSLIGVYSNPEVAGEFGHKVSVSNGTLVVTSPGQADVDFWHADLNSGGDVSLSPVQSGPGPVGAIKRGATMDFDWPFVAIGTASLNGNSQSANSYVDIWNLSVDPPLLEANINKDFDGAPWFYVGNFGRQVSIDASGACAVMSGSTRHAYVFRRDASGAWQNEWWKLISSVPVDQTFDYPNTDHQDIVLDGDELFIADGDGGGLISLFRYSPSSSTWSFIEDIATASSVGLSLDVQDGIIASPDPNAPVPVNSVRNRTGVGVLLARSQDGSWSSDYREALPLVFSNVELDRVNNNSATIDASNMAVTTNADGRWAFNYSIEVTGDNYGYVRIYNDAGDGWEFVQSMIFPAHWMHPAAMAADGDRLVLGFPRTTTASSNLVCLTYTGDPNAPWSASQEFLRSDLASEGMLGYSVAIDGDWMVAGIAGMTTGGVATDDTLRLATFKWTGSSWQMKDVQAVANLGVVGGTAVAVRENIDGSATAAIGMPGLGNGAVFLYEISPDGASTDLLDVVFGPTTGTNTLYGVETFGRELSIDGNTLAVGCLTREPGMLGACVYTLDDEGFCTLEDCVSTYQRSNPWGQLFVRGRIALEDDVLVLATPSLSYFGEQTGGATVFERNGTEWRVHGRLVPKADQIQSIYLGITRVKLGSGLAIENGKIMLATAPSFDPLALEYDWSSEKTYWTSTACGSTNGI